MPFLKTKKLLRTKQGNDMSRCTFLKGLSGRWKAVQEAHENRSRKTHKKLGSYPGREIWIN